MQLDTYQTEDVNLSWAEIQENWTTAIDLIVLHFPHTDRLELLKLHGELAAFTHYLANVQDLTLKEALDAVDFVLLKDPNMHQRLAQAA